MISQTAEYALRAIVFLADHGHNPRTTAQIAEATHVPAGYLAKVMQSLSRAGVVQSQRGLNGGFILSGQPHELTILDVVNAVDPIRRFQDRTRVARDAPELLGTLHRHLDAATDMVEQVFAQTTIHQVLCHSDNGNGHSSPPKVIGPLGSDS